MLNCYLNFLLSIRVSPAVTINIHFSSPTLNDNVFAILAGITPTAFAVSSTVALDCLNSFSPISGELP